MPDDGPGFRRAVADGYLAGQARATSGQWLTLRSWQSGCGARGGCTAGWPPFRPSRVQPGSRIVPNNHGGATKILLIY